jgi:hypothetical protein
MRGPRLLMIAPPGTVLLRGPQGRELAERVAALQAESERMHREAERAYREVRREIHVRLEGGPHEPEAVESADASGASHEAGSDEDPHPQQPLPPWHFWFESDVQAPDPAAGEDEVVAQVRAALTGVLENEGGVLPSLGPEEFVAVAVDFVSDPFFASEDSRDRTLVVRARYRDVQARLEGRLSPEQFRERIAYEEY